MKSSEKNNLIVLQGGIGDVLLWIPALKAFNRPPDVLYLYNTPHIAALKENGLVNHVYRAETKLQLLLFALKRAAAYEYCYLNHLCGGTLLLRIMKAVSRMILTNSANYQPEKNVTKKDVLLNVHDALQNYYLVHDRKPQLSCSNFELDIACKDEFDLPEKFFVVQISAGDSKTPYKNWPVSHWSDFAEQFFKEYPGFSLVLLGHPLEAVLVKEMSPHPSMISLIGKTSIGEAFCIIQRSLGFIGLDGGLMHVAVAMGRPTFTIWGGSSPQLYGYMQFSGQPHKIVQNHMSCGPCNAWQQPNLSKTTDPARCGDFECLLSLSPRFAFDQFRSFMASMP